MQQEIYTSKNTAIWCGSSKKWKNKSPCAKLLGDNRCNRWKKSDYGQKLGAIAGITGFKKDSSRYSRADFPEELSGPFRY